MEKNQFSLTLILVVTFLLTVEAKETSLENLCKDQNLLTSSFNYENLNVANTSVTQYPLSRGKSTQRILKIQYETQMNYSQSLETRCAL